MEKEYVMQVADTIREKLVGMTPFNTIMSWGIGRFVATVYKDMPALMFSVNGRLHKGTIIIALDRKPAGTPVAHHEGNQPKWNRHRQKERT